MILKSKRNITKSECLSLLSHFASFKEKMNCNQKTFLRHFQCQEKKKRQFLFEDLTLNDFIVADLWLTRPNL